MSGTKEQGKHTPGPWREGEGGMLSRLNVWAGAAYQIAQVKRFPAADVVRQIRADAEAEANARLIAAAPELLEMLTRCVKLLEIANIAGKSTYASDVRMGAQAAIAKAEGRQ